jgi:hypothetical protein
MFYGLASSPRDEFKTLEHVGCEGLASSSKVMRRIRLPRQSGGGESRSLRASPWLPAQPTYAAPIGAAHNDSPCRSTRTTSVIRF